MKNLKLMIFFAILLAAVRPAWAWQSRLLDSTTLVAQTESEDAYDPFADYSEFEESAEEEADINFFRNGRFFTLGAIVGYRGQTDQMASISGGAPSFGLFLTYFFDLRFALQISFKTSTHNIAVKSESTDASGSLSFSNIALNVKYYLNTQNVTKGLADLNPYILGGFSQVYRTITLEGEDAFAKDQALGVDIGAGMEFPILRNKMFFGGEVAYQLVNFADENKEIILNDGTGPEPTGKRLSGDIYTILGVIGINF